MFKLAEKQDKEKIVDFCAESLLGAYVICRLETYGFDYDFAKYWISEDDTGVNAVVSSFDGAATVYANERADHEEMKTFLAVLGFGTVVTDEYTAEKCGFDDVICKQSFVYKGANEDYTAEDDIDLKKAYKLICKAIPNSFTDSEEAYLSFLSDFTFRKNRKHARIKGFADSLSVISCAMTSAETTNSAIISGVACSEERRGGGFGKRTVLSIADELKSEEKTVYVIALNKSAEKFYEKIGFVPYEKIAYYCSKS